MEEPTSTSLLEHLRDQARASTGGPVRRNARSRAGDRVRRFVFTLNNWTDEEYTYLTEEFVPVHSKWAVIGKEQAETGTKHLQGTCCVAERYLYCTCEFCSQ